MKNYIYGFLLIFIVLTHPTYAADTTCNEPSIQLNQLTYSPIHTAQRLNDTLYLSGEDLASMTYGTYEVLENGEYLLTIQNHRILYTPNSRFIKLNNISKILTESTYTIDEITYLPVQVLDLIQYPYTLSEDATKLSITPLLPYSTATDSPDSHRLLSTNFKNFSEAFRSLLSEDETTKLITEAKQTKSYVSFMSTTYKNACFEAMAELGQSPSYQKRQTKVYLRQLNRHSKTPTLSGFTVLPVNYKMSQEGLNVKIGEQTYTSTFFWSTYNAINQEPLYIDLNKSLDMMLMRTLYAYYREQYDLKDDLSTTPIVTIQMGRSDQMRYHTYLNHTTTPTHLQVVIYRMTTGTSIDYYIDLVAD